MVFFSMFVNSNIPRDVVLEVIQKMGPLQLFNLCLTNNVVKRLVKRALKRKQFHVKLSSSPHEFVLYFGFRGCHQGARTAIIEIRNSPSACMLIGSESSWKIDDSTVVPIELSDYGDMCTTSWNLKNENECFEKMLNILTDVFNIPEVSLEFQNQDEEDVLKLITSVKERGLRFQSLSLSGISLSDDSYKFIFDQAPISSQIELLCYSSPQLQYLKFAAFSLDFLKIEHADWITVENLKSLGNCKSVELQSHRLTNEDLNVFLQYWMKSESCAINRLSIRGQSLDLWLVVCGLQATMKDGIWTYFGGFQKTEPGKCFEITRINGTKATVYQKDSNFLLTIYE